MTRIQFFAIFEGIADPFYIDDMKLVTRKTEELVTGVEMQEAGMEPTDFALSQNFPNPFNPITTIAYDLPQACDVTLTIYALTGQFIAVLVDAPQKAGHHTAVFDGSRFANGIYVYRLETERFVETRRMVLLR